MQQFFEIFHDLPGFLDGFIHSHGPWVYALLFAIIFAETGLVIFPFLPGDSLLFAVGVLMARGSLHSGLILTLLILAPIIGDTLNYQLGKWLGPRIFKFDENSGRPTRLQRLLNRKHLDRTHKFYEKYGGKAVILGRFVPIVRTFVPFVAGAGAMTYPKFFAFSVAGAFLWIGVCVGAGYAFGDIDWVQQNFEAVVVAIICISLLPIGVEALLAYRRKRVARRNAVGSE